MRDILLAKIIPVLVGPQSTTPDLQAASDILTVAGTHENLAGAIKPEYVHTVVKWHLELFKNSFLRAAQCLTSLRESAPFIPVIAAIENKNGIHVVGENISDSPTQILLLEFNRAHHNLEISIMDVSKPEHHRKPRIIEIDGEAMAHSPQISKLLLASTELPEQEWVGSIAIEAHHRLG